MKKSELLLSVFSLSAIFCLVSLPTYADSSGYSRISQLTFELTDLNINDAIDPSLNVDNKHFLNYSYATGFVNDDR